MHDMASGRELLRQNSSNLRYYTEILRVHGIDVERKLSVEEEKRAEEVVAKYEEALPRATAHQRLLLRILSGERFRKRFTAYARPLLVKGAPALLVDLKKDVYSDAGKVQIVEDVLLQHIASLEKDSTLAGETEE